MLIFFLYFFVVIPMALLICAACYFLLAFPTYKIAQKAGYDKAWLAWIPGMDTLVLMDLKHGAPITLLPNWTLEDRFVTGLIFCLGRIFAPGILCYIPVVGWICACLPVVSAVAGHVNYIVFKEVLDRYTNDEEGNKTKAMIVAIADVFCGGLVRGIYLLTLMNKDALPQPVYSED